MLPAWLSISTPERLRCAARYLVISTMRVPEVAEQLDSGTVLAMTAPRTVARSRPGAPATTSR
jgi:hypothetical protein